MKKVLSFIVIIISLFMSGCMMDVNSYDGLIQTTYNDNDQTMKPALLIVNSRYISGKSFVLLDANGQEYGIVPLSETAAYCDISVRRNDSRNNIILEKNGKRVYINYEKGYALKSDNENILIRDPGAVDFFCKPIEKDILVDVNSFTKILKYLNVSVKYQIDYENEKIFLN